MKRKQTKESLLKEITHQLGVANALKKVEMTYRFYEYLRTESGYPHYQQERLMDDFNNSIDMAYDA